MTVWVLHGTDLDDLYRTDQNFGYEVPDEIWARYQAASALLADLTIEIQRRPYRDLDDAMPTNSLPDYVDTAEAAGIAGVTPASFRTMMHRGVVPDPARYFAATPVWVRETITEWALTRRRKTKG